MPDLSCRELADLVTAHLDGELDCDTERRFVAHQVDCEGCGCYLDQFLGDHPRAGRATARQPARRSARPDALDLQELASVLTGLLQAPRTLQIRAPA